MNRFGSNSFENENDQFAQNQRIGRQMGENNPRPWNETPNPKQGFLNRHYSSPQYRPDHPDAYRSNDAYRPDYGQPHFYAGQHNDYPANDPAWRHHDDREWTERNDFKDSDYRYRSGHRGFWHEDYDDTYEKEQHPRHRPHEDSFFTHVGQGIREGWNNLFHRHPEEERYQQPPSRHDENRYQGPSVPWPNPDERYNYENRRNQQRNMPPNREWPNPGPGRRHNDDFYNEENWRL